MAKRLEASAPASSTADHIAIVGIGCRFPGGSNDPRALWENLTEGVDCITEVPADRWRPENFYHPKKGTRGKSVTRWGAFIDGISEFDAAFFGISPREAALMDPQQRMLLEVCWEALEDAGQIPSSLRDRPVGVFMGGFTLDYMLMQLGGTDYRSVQAHTATGSMMTMLAARLSYVFGFRGPSLAVDTACSSSMVAVHLACQSLASGESEVAIAGGVSALLGPSYTIAEAQAGMMSPTGRSGAFDSRADGYVRGEGAGIVVLKRLADAIAAGDPIYAVIRATAVNQDGHNEGLTVPSGDAQRELIRKACKSAGVLPNQIAYVEAHGTGTPVGDPVEANAIGSVMGEGRDPSHPCLIGSIKTNIGHTEAAAGVAGLIKAALILKHGMVPPNLNFAMANPAIDLAALKLQVPIACTQLPTEAKQSIASVNSFGFGGTNAHAILGTAPAALDPSDPASAAHCWMLPLSARHPDALRQLGARYAASLSPGGYLASTGLDALCWSTATRREQHAFRECVVGKSREDLIAGLLALRDGGANADTLCDFSDPAIAVRENPAQVFVYSGMGPQWWGMGQTLYRTEPVFRATVDRCAALYEAVAGWSILDQMLAAKGESRSGDTDVAQSAGFILQVALTDLLASWGVVPAAIVGHSAGEVAAAYAAGCLSLEDAVVVVFHRSRLQHQTSGQGAMLAIGLPGEQTILELAAVSDPSLSVAAINSPTQTTVVGSVEAIERLAERLAAREVFTKRLRVQAPFHSVFMDALEPGAHASLGHIQPRAPRIPLYSTVTGGLIDKALHDSHYWFRNMREPVYFADAAAALVRAGFHHFVEVSPHPVLAGSIVECATAVGVNCRVVTTLHRDRDETLQFAATLAHLYSVGCTLTFADKLPKCPPTDLPNYPWRHERFWHETPASAKSRMTCLPHPLLTRRVDMDVPTWEADLDGPSLAFLQDHCIQGTVVFPGAGYVDMAAFAARSLFGDLSVVTFADIVFERALYLSPDKAITLRISVDPKSYTFRITSQPYEEADGNWDLHCTGHIYSRDQPRGADADLAAIEGRCSVEVAPDVCYAYFKKLGLEYGPTFRGITRLNQGQGESLARVEVPLALHQEVDRFCIHPAILDQCFQTLAAALPFDSDGSTVYMPTGVAQGRSYGELPLKMWIHANITRQDPRAVYGDIRIYDDAGTLVLEIVECSAKVLGGDAGGFVESPQKLYAPTWIAQDGPAEADFVDAGRWLLLGEDDLAEELAHTLENRGNQCVRLCSTAHAQAGARRSVDPTDSASWSRLIESFSDGMPLRGVINVMAAQATPSHNDDELMDGLESDCLATLNIVKALATSVATSKPRIWMVTRGTQQVVAGDRPDPFRGAVWGLARVMGHFEHIDLWGGIIDLAHDAPASDSSRVADECLANDVEDQIALRGEARFVLRLDACAPSVSLALPPRLRSDASYLVTGGLGALGLAVSAWMVERGARHLILLGRTGLPARREWMSLASTDPAAPIVAQIRQLEALGANVSIECLDIADRQALDALVHRVRAEARPPIRGVIHSAGVARPRLLGQSDNSEFLSVMPAKVRGAWNLHGALEGEPLDFFILFSSVAALVTSMGQGNYAAANTFLDLLAHQRRADGLPATSVNWGPWGDVGMATQLDLLTFFHDRGLYPMSAAQGCQALGWLMSGRAPQAIVLGAKWSLVGESSPLSIAAPMLHKVIADEQAFDQSMQAGAGITSTINIMDVLDACPDEVSRTEAVAHHVRDLACRVLRIDVSTLDLDTSISSQGMDSMMAIELKNRIEHSLKVSVSIVDLLKGASPREIAMPLAAQIEAQRSMRDDVAVAELYSSLSELSDEEVRALLGDDADAGEPA